MCAQSVGKAIGTAMTYAQSKAHQTSELRARPGYSASMQQQRQTARPHPKIPPGMKQYQKRSPTNKTTTRTPPRTYQGNEAQ